MSDTLFSYDLEYLDATFIKSSVDYIWQADGKLWVDMGKALTDNYHETVKKHGYPTLYEITDWLDDIETLIREPLYELQYTATQDYAYILVEDDHISNAVAVCGGNEENYYDELWDVREWLDTLHSEIDTTYYSHVASLIADVLRGATATGVPVI